MHVRVVTCRLHGRQLLRVTNASRCSGLGFAMVILKGLGYSATFQTGCVCVCVCAPRLDDLQAMNQPVLTFIGHRDPKQPVYVKLSRNMSCTGRDCSTGATGDGSQFMWVDKA